MLRLLSLVNYAFQAERIMKRKNKKSRNPKRVEESLKSSGLTLLREPMLFLLGITVLCLAASPLTGIIYILATIHAMRGQRETIESFTILALVLLGHPAVFSGQLKILRWAILAAGIGRIFWDWLVVGKAIKFPSNFTTSFGIFFTSTLVASIAVSRIPSLSLLKLISFAIGVFTIFVCFHNTRNLNKYWKDWFYTFFLYSLIASILIFATGMGYFRTREGFQGIWRHSQIMGPIASMMTAWFIGQFIYCNEKNAKRILLFSSLLGVVFVFLSGARTAALALGAGLLIALGVIFLRSKPNLSIQRLLFNSLTGLTAFLLVVAMIMFPAEFESRIQEFVNKDGIETEAVGAGDASELFLASRGGLLSKSMENFRESPVFGIGFGVPSNFTIRANATESVLGIPTSASSEKGFMPSAILEEVGLVGSILLLIVMVMVSLPIHKFGDLSLVWMYWSGLFVNVGAAIFFSVGGLGFFLWLIIGFCYTQSNLTKRRKQYRKQTFPKSMRRPLNYKQNPIHKPIVH